MGLNEQHPDAEQRDVHIDKRHRSRESGDPISDPQLKIRGPLCPVRHHGGGLLPTLWLRGVHVISELDHLTRTVKSTPHRGGTSGYCSSAACAWGGLELFTVDLTGAVVTCG